MLPSLLLLPGFLRKWGINKLYDKATPAISSTGSSYYEPCNFQIEKIGLTEKCLKSLTTIHMQLSLQLKFGTPLSEQIEPVIAQRNISIKIELCEWAVECSGGYYNIAIQ